VLNLSAAVKLWLCTRPVDMRLGFDGLYVLVGSLLKADPLSGHLFVFSNRAANRLKVLYYSRNGLCLWAQRLEAGRYHFPKPRQGSDAVELTAAQFEMILDGIDLDDVRRFKRYRHPG
jgi:transposase